MLQVSNPAWIGRVRGTFQKYRHIHYNALIAFQKKTTAFAGGTLNGSQYFTFDFFLWPLHVINVSPPQNWLYPIGFTCCPVTFRLIPGISSMLSSPLPHWRAICGPWITTTNPTFLDNWQLWSLCAPPLLCSSSIWLLFNNQVHR